MYERNSGGEWSGNMTVGDAAEFQIQWIEMTFNTSGPVAGPAGGTNKRSIDVLEKRKKKEKGCEVVCKIDGVKSVGTPEIVSVNMSLATGISVSWRLLVVVGLASLLAGL